MEAKGLTLKRCSMLSSSDCQTVVWKNCLYSNSYWLMIASGHCWPSFSLPLFMKHCLKSGIFRQAKLLHVQWSWLTKSQRCFSATHSHLKMRAHDALRYSLDQWLLVIFGMIWTTLGTQSNQKKTGYDGYDISCSYHVKLMFTWNILKLWTRQMVAEPNRTYWGCSEKQIPKRTRQLLRPMVHCISSCSFSHLHLLFGRCSCHGCSMFTAPQHDPGCSGICPLLHL